MILPKEYFPPRSHYLVGFGDKDLGVGFGVTFLLSHHMVGSGGKDLILNKY